MVTENAREIHATMSDTYVRMNENFFKPREDFLSRLASPSFGSKQAAENQGQATGTNRNNQSDIHSKMIGDNVLSIDMENTGADLNCYVDIRSEIGDNVGSSATVKATGSVLGDYLDMQLIKTNVGGAET